MDLAIKPARENAHEPGRRLRRPTPPPAVQLIFDNRREDGLQAGLFLWPELWFGQWNVHMKDVLEPEDAGVLRKPVADERREAWSPIDEATTGTLAPRPQTPAATL